MNLSFFNVLKSIIFSLFIIIRIFYIYYYSLPTIYGDYMHTFNLIETLNRYPHLIPYYNCYYLNLNSPLAHSNWVLQLRIYIPGITPSQISS